MSRIFSEETNGGGREGGRHSSRHCSAAALPRPSFPLPPIPRSLSPPAISSVPRRRRLAAAAAASPPPPPPRRLLLLFCLLVRFLGNFIRNLGHLPMKPRITCTEVEVFMENGVRGRAQTAGANSRRGATKKREISRNLFPINLHS